MGVNFGATLGHRLGPEDLLALPQRLNPEAAPGLTRAIADLARAVNDADAAYERENPRANPQSPLSADEPWGVKPPSEPLYRGVGGQLTTERQARVYVPVPPALRQRMPHVHWEEWKHPGPVGWRQVPVVTAWERQETIEVHGPAGLWLNFGPHACDLSGGIVRWWSFLDDPLQQLAMRRICQQVASLLDSPVVIYVSELWDVRSTIMEGRSIEEILAHLQSRHGPPAESLAALRDDQTRLGYFIDRLGTGLPDTDLVREGH
jgi:hypothetical protein